MKVTEELKQFRAMSGPEMRARIDELREEKFRLQTQRATGQLTRTARLRQVRKEMARIQTVLTERNL